VIREFSVNRGDIKHAQCKEGREKNERGGGSNSMVKNEEKGVYVNSGLTSFRSVEQARMRVLNRPRSGLNAWDWVRSA
jgi:hypothetical protein